MGKPLGASRNPDVVSYLGTDFFLSRTAVSPVDIQARPDLVLGMPAVGGPDLERNHCMHQADFVPVFLPASPCSSQVGTLALPKDSKRKGPSPKDQSMVE